MTSIESGYFVMTMMPSLFCKHRCPHCYLSLEERKNPAILRKEDLELTCRKIDDYYEKRKIERKTIIHYWYGGEPTQMPVEYFLDCASMMGDIFSTQKGYETRHSILSSLVGIDWNVWGDIFSRYCQGEVQTSYDGRMRGEKYLERWRESVEEATRRGLDVSTISVVNRKMLEDGAKKTLDDLMELSIRQTSWLPFMQNGQNEQTGKYQEMAPRMDEWSQFMIELTEYSLEQSQKGLSPPEIGQMRFALHQRENDPIANIASQTLFLMPNGDLTLPDYRDGWMEYMLPFGNILESSFEEILQSPTRRGYLRRQVSRNGNQECLDCPHGGYCMMEFWKDNRPGDDCFGGRKYLEWLLEQPIHAKSSTLY